MASSAGDRFLRRLSASNGADEGVCGGLQQEYGGGAGAGRRGSRRWSKKRAAAAARGYGGGNGGYGVKQQAEAGASATRKRVMVVVDESSGSKHAMMWALTHVANKGDFLTLLHVLPHSGSGRGEEASSLANSLGTLCKASRPEVEVEALVIQGPKLGTVLSQVKLEACVLVLGQCKPSPYCWLSCNSEFVEDSTCWDLLPSPPPSAPHRQRPRGPRLCSSPAAAAALHRGGGGPRRSPNGGAVRSSSSLPTPPLTVLLLLQP